MDNDTYTILVIDDEEPIRRLLLNELSNSRRSVQVADCGAKGLQMLREFWFDVVLLDLRLPDVKDFELLVSIRESVPDCEVIMITGNGDIESYVEAKRIGVYEFVRKPFNLDLLEMLIEKAHQRVVMSK